MYNVTTITFAKHRQECKKKGKKEKKRRSLTSSDERYQNITWLSSKKEQRSW